jgi:UDP-perosamine 4-acetyltransferase
MNQQPGRPLILLGAGGHAAVLLALARAAGLQVSGVCDPALVRAGCGAWQGLPVLGDDSALDAVGPDGADLINGIGATVVGAGRRNIYGTMRARGFRFPPLVHPFSWVAPDVQLADGVQVMAGAVIQPGSTLGENSIVNTRASVDHDARIGAHVHIAPGAILCGNVTVGDGAFVAAGATVVQGITIGAAATVAAGTTVVRDLAPGHLVVGSPNRASVPSKSER